MGSDRRGTGRGCARHIRQLARPNPLRLMPPYALECNPRCMIANKWPKKTGSTFCTFADRASAGSWPIAWLDLQSPDRL